MTKGRANSDRADRPIGDEILGRARAIVADYQIIVTSEGGEWYGRGLELPQVYGDGATPAQSIENTREALAVAVAYLLEQGQAYPTPAKHGKRTTQVNVRLTPELHFLKTGCGQAASFSRRS